MRGFIEPLSLLLSLSLPLSREEEICLSIEEGKRREGLSRRIKEIFEKLSEKEGGGGGGGGGGGKMLLMVDEEEEEEKCS